MEFITGVYLFFIFVSLYSIFLVLLLHFRSRGSFFDDIETKNFPEISVLIPAFNEEKNIVETVNAIKAVDYPEHLKEIIVIDDKSTDNTLEIARRIEGIKVIAKDKNTKKADTLNTGLREAKGEIIVVTDADSFPERDSFKKMLSYFNDPKTASVTSTILVKNPSNILEKFQAIEYYLIAWGRKILDNVDSVYVTPGPLSMFRKNVLKKVGGFDTNNLTEDIEIAWKNLKHGYKNRMCLSSRVYTNVPSKLKKWWRQRLRWDIGGLQTMYKYKSSVFKKSQSIFGLFVVPKFLISHVLSLTGFFVFLYITYQHAKRFVLLNLYSISTDTSLLKVNALSLTPSVFTFFILFLFSVALYYTIVGLKTINKANLGFRGNATLLFYLLFYLALYPLILLHSIYLIATGNIKW